MVSAMPKPLRTFLSLGSSLVLAAAFAACSSTSTTTSTDAGGGGTHLSFCDLPKVCQEIAEACHVKDDGTPGEVHDCHETGHDVGTVEACTKVHDSCLKTCNAAPDLGGPHEDLGAACKKDGGTAPADAATKG